MKQAIIYAFKAVTVFLVVSCVTIVAFSAGAAESLTYTAQKYYYGQGVSRDFNKAFQLYLQAAEKGDVDAMFIVGGMYKLGQGTVVNSNEAFKWLYKAALNGRSSKESERILAQSFITGDDVPQNFTEAVHWYELAADRGDVEAQSELAYLHFTGKLGEKDYKKAAHWFNVSARNGYPMAQYNMGIMWYTGNGVEAVDMVKAYTWFSLSAVNGHKSAISSINYLKTVLSEEELQKAQNMSMELYKEIKQIKRQEGLQ